MAEHEAQNTWDKIREEAEGGFHERIGDDQTPSHTADDSLNAQMEEPELHDTSKAIADEDRGFHETLDGETGTETGHSDMGGDTPTREYTDEDNT